MKAIDKLRARWKGDDMWFYYPVGLSTNADARWLHSLFNDDFIQQARMRGYDISTFKFELSPMQSNEKFKSQREESK